MMRKSKNGYSLIELMVAISIFSILAVVTFNSLKTMRDNHLIEENEASIDLREIIKQELILQGVNIENEFNLFAEYGDVDSKINEFKSELNVEGKAEVCLLSALFYEERERINVAGKIIKKGINPVSHIASALYPPKANYFNKIDLSMFPLQYFILPTSKNPLGTYYRYTLDGRNPESSSPIWDFSALNFNNWSQTMKFRAFNANPQYVESEILNINLNLEARVKLQREDGSNSLDVSYEEIIENSNRILIKSPLEDPSIDIRYRINNGVDIKYTNPFHVPFEHWNLDGVTLVVEIRVPQYSMPVSVQEFRLNIRKEQLPKPQILPPGGNLRIGSRIEIRTNRNIARTETIIDGQEKGFFFNIVDI